MSDFLGDSDEKPIGLVFRPATSADIAAVFAADMEHTACDIDGTLAGLFSTFHADGRLWGWLRVLGRYDWMIGAHLVVAMRRGLAKYTEPVWIVQHDAEAALLLRALRFEATDEMMGKRRVWVWHPPRSCSGGTRRP